MVVFSNSYSKGLGVALNSGFPLPFLTFPDPAPSISVFCPSLRSPQCPTACSSPFSFSLFPEILPGDQQVRSAWPCPLSHLALVCQGHRLVHPLLPFSRWGFPCPLCGHELDLSLSSGTSQTSAGDRCGQGHRRHSVLLSGGWWRGQAFQRCAR